MFQGQPGSGPNRSRSNPVKGGQRWSKVVKGGQGKFKKRFKPGLEAEPDPDLTGSIPVEPGQVIAGYRVPYSRLYPNFQVSILNFK